MKRFRLTSNIVFDAENLDGAFQALADHFLYLALKDDDDMVPRVVVDGESYFPGELDILAGEIKIEPEEPGPARIG